MFVRVSGTLCPTCVRDTEDTFQMVRAYLRGNRHASMAEVVEALEVDPDLLDALVREGRLMFANGESGRTCRRCQTAISAGDYCAKCKNLLATELASRATQLRAATAQDTARRPGYYGRG